MSRQQSSKNSATEPVPPAGKVAVTRTTTERFIDEVQGRDDGEEQPSPRGADVLVMCNECGKSSPRSEWLENNDDCPRCEPDDQSAFLDDEPVRSSLDMLLASWGASGGSDGATIYVKRKPDPLGMTFAVPCQTEMTVGELPFDESFTTLAAIELAVQTSWGGGRYQIQVLQDGRYLKAKTVIVSDPQRRPDAPANGHNPAPFNVTAAAPVVDPIDTMLATVQKFASIGRELGWNRNDHPAPAGPPAPPALPPVPSDPFAAATSAFDLVNKVRELAGQGSGNGVPGEKPSTARVVTDGIVSLVKEAGNAPAVLKALDWAHSAWRASQDRVRLEAEAAQRANGHQPPPPQQALPAGPQGAPVQATPPPPLHAFVYHAPPDEHLCALCGIDFRNTTVHIQGAAGANHVEPLPVETAPPATAGGLELPAPEVMAVLELVVAELEAWSIVEDDDEATQTTAHLNAAADAMQTLSPFKLMELANMGSPAISLWLASLKPEWSKFAETSTAATFIDALKTTLAERMGLGEEPGSEPANEEGEISA